MVSYYRVVTVTTPASMASPVAPNTKAEHQHLLQAPLDNKFEILTIYIALVTAAYTPRQKPPFGQCCTLHIYNSTKKIYLQPLPQFLSTIYKEYIGPSISKVHIYLLKLTIHNIIVLINQLTSNQTLQALIATLRLKYLQCLL